MPVEPRVGLETHFIALFNDDYGKDIGVRPESDTSIHQVRAVWLEKPLSADWTIAFRLLMQRGAPIIAEIRVFPHESSKDRKFGEWSACYLGSRALAPDGGLTVTHIKRIRIDRHLFQQAIDLARDTSPWWQDFMAQEGFPIPAAAPPEKPKNPNRGRPSIPDIEFARLAKFYTDRCASGSLTPIEETAAHFKLSISTARARLHTARNPRELLTGGRQGRSGGKLTDKAIELLKTDKGATKRVKKQR